jgi:hypothetical protein
MPGRQRNGGSTSAIGRRWTCIALTMCLAVGGCWSSGPDHAEALAQIAMRIRSAFGPGEKTLSNLIYKRGEEMDGDRYAVFVDYDLISTMPEIGLFNTPMRAGDHLSVSAERYIFVSTRGEWTLQ